jgi:proprotein convertase subtilisin/kexin type 5
VPKGFFKDDSTRTCKPCSEQPGCANCIEPNKCIQCLDYMFLHNYKCIPSCPEIGYFNNIATYKCNECDKSCKSCSSGDPNSCLTCNDNLIFLKNSCLDRCEYGYYKKLITTITTDTQLLNSLLNTNNISVKNLYECTECSP